MCCTDALLSSERREMMSQFLVTGLRARVQEVIARVPAWRPGLGAADDVPLRSLPWQAIARQAFWMWLATRIVFALITYFAQLVTVSAPSSLGTPLPLHSFAA